MLITEANKGYPQSLLLISSPLDEDRARPQHCLGAFAHPKVVGEGCLSQGQRQAFKKYPCRISCEYLSMALQGQECIYPRASHCSHPHCPKRSSLPKRSTPAQDVSHRLVRDLSNSEDTAGVLVVQAAQPPLLPSPGYQKCYPLSLCL